MSLLPPYEWLRTFSHLSLVVFGTGFAPSLDPSFVMATLFCREHVIILLSGFSKRFLCCTQVRQKDAYKLRIDVVFIDVAPAVDDAGEGKLKGFDAAYCHAFRTSLTFRMTPK